jgi:hypothetical protein
VMERERERERTDRCCGESRGSGSLANLIVLVVEIQARCFCRLERGLICLDMEGKRERRHGERERGFDEIKANGEDGERRNAMRGVLSKILRTYRLEKSDCASPPQQMSNVVLDDGSK